MSKKSLFFLTLAFVLLLTTSAFALTQTTVFVVSINSPITFGQLDRPLGFLYSGTEYKAPYTNGLNGYNVTVYWGHTPTGTTNYLGRFTTYSYQLSGNSYPGFFLSNQFIRPKKNFYYKAVFDGDATYAGTSLVSDKAIVKVKISTSGRREGPRYKFTGTVSPNHANKYVYIQVKRKGGPWRTVKRAKLSPKSTFTYYYTWARGGTYYIRAIFNADSDHGKNVSAPRGFKV